METKMLTRIEEIENLIRENWTVNGGLTLSAKDALSFLNVCRNKANAQEIIDFIGNEPDGAVEAAVYYAAKKIIGTPLFGVFHADPMGRPDDEPEGVFESEEEAGKYADLLNERIEPYNAGTDDNPSWREHSYFVSEM